MNDKKNALLQCIFSASECTEKPLSNHAINLIADELLKFELEDVIIAVRSAMAAAPRLALSNILEHLKKNDGYVDGNEAWAIAINLQSEFETVCATDEIMQAFYVARPVLDEGDKVGARMAFLAAYERLVAQSRRQGKAPKWNVTLGFDAAEREIAVRRAREMGRLSHSVEQLLLSVPGEADLTTTQMNRARDIANENIAKIKRMLAEGEKKRQDQAEQKWQEGQEMREAKRKQAAWFLAQEEERKRKEEQGRQDAG